MRRIAVFLRAVNLTGRSLKMADFKAALADAGFEGAETLAAAGNAVIEAEAAAADAALEGRIEAALAVRLGQAIEVFARDGAELAAIVAANPFGAFAAADPGRMVVVFLKGQDPSPGAVAALQDWIPGREQVAAGPRSLYATYPDGAGRSKLNAAAIERRLGDRSTARNWNTVRRMAELTAGA